MYLSPRVAPPTYMPPPRRHLTLTRSGTAERAGRSLCHSFRSRSLHSSTFPLFPSFFFLPCSFRASSVRLPLSHPYATTMCNTHARAYTQLSRSPCVLTHVYFSLLFLRLPPPLLLALGVVLHCAHRSLTHTNDDGIRTPSNRRVASSRVVLRALTDFSISILFSRIRRNITARC